MKSKTMHSKNATFRLTAIAAVAANTFAGAAWAQEAPAAAASEDATKLDTVEVTGSRLRQVDMETASPVFVIDRKAIEASGVQAVGDLIQKMPSISGAATNPQVNNGGGDGASVVSLRGLGEERTLVLLNGTRLSQEFDVNSIPINMIERVEILKEGAGAVYGSDAIGGVVNFITRKDIGGLEVFYDYGETGRGDGRRDSLGMVFGMNAPKGNLALGVNYNKQDGISAGERSFSRDAIYLYGSVFAGGSSRIPNGRLFTEDGVLGGTDYGCTSVTRIEGAAGDSEDDYRCFTADDLYNYQPFNLILTPQERGSLFTIGNYEVNEHVGLYTELYHNFTRSGFQIAPLPFDARSDDVVVSADNVYNPFGRAFGGATPDSGTGTLNPNMLVRMEGLGNRRSLLQTQQTQAKIGFKGEIADTWQWDAYYAYNRTYTHTKTDGYLLKSRLDQAFGPSFIAGDGTPTCGTPDAPISGCTPINIFNANAPDTVAALATISGQSRDDLTFTNKEFQAFVSGNIASLPAGPLQLGVGYAYNEQQEIFDTDTLTQAQPPDFTSCGLAQETCTGDVRGEDNAKEIFAEVLIPVMADQPGVELLNLTLGGRYSKYKSFGSTNNYTAKVEYRPNDDLMVRASFAEVFRAPQIDDRLQPPTANSPTFNDPCVGLTQADVDANPNLALACENVPRDGSFEQPNSQVTGIIQGPVFSGLSLGPEEGEVFTGGFVYDAPWLKGFSATLDFWNYKIDRAILGGLGQDVNTTADICVANGDPTACGLIHRFADGTINFIQQPIANLDGGFETNGIDLGIDYALGSTPLGTFRFSLDATRTNKFDFTQGGNVTEAAGTFDRQFGHFAKLRVLGGINWSGYGVNVLYNVRYIGPVNLKDPDGAPGVQPDLEVPSYTYHGITVGYTLPVTNTELLVGADNIFDKQPPLMFQNNVTNANTDVSTYDTVGTDFFVRITQRF